MYRDHAPNMRHAVSALLVDWFACGNSGRLPYPLGPARAVAHDTAYYYMVSRNKRKRYHVYEKSSSDAAETFV